jgi:hypothetical protein
MFARISGKNATGYIYRRYTDTRLVLTALNGSFAHAPQRWSRRRPATPRLAEILGSSAQAVDRHPPIVVPAGAGRPLISGRTLGPADGGIIKG